MPFRGPDFTRRVAVTGLGLPDAAVREIVDGFGADLVMDCSGHPSAGPEGIETKLKNLMEVMFEHSTKTQQRFRPSRASTGAGATSTRSAHDRGS